MRRYAVDTSTLAESADGAVVMVGDLPVQALNNFHKEFRIVESDGYAIVILDKGEYTALRDLWLAIRPEVKS